MLEGIGGRNSASPLGEVRKKEDVVWTFRKIRCLTCVLGIRGGESTPAAFRLDKSESLCSNVCPPSQPRLVFNLAIN